MSNDAGVSSSLILFPSYKNLPILNTTQGEKHDQFIIPKANLQQTVIQTAFVNVPDSSNIFSDLVGICRLKLRQLRVPLDFKKDLLSRGRQNLRIRHNRGKRREIEVENISIHGWIMPSICQNGERTLMLIDAVPLSSCLATASLVCSVSDIVRRLSVEVVEFKYQESPSAATMVAEGQRRVGLRATSK